MEKICSHCEKNVLQWKAIEKYHTDASKEAFKFASPCSGYNYPKEHHDLSEHFSKQN